ncbi:MAG: flagellar motor protein MotB [Treponema sp.]|nr:flagellar motor protein MotB [Treponema sp.]
MARKNKKEAEKPSELWMVTYTDMLSLLLCFFVALFNVDDTTAAQIAAMASAFTSVGLGPSVGGNTLTAGRSVDLGNTIMSLPSMESGRSLGTALRKAISLFNPEVRSNMVKITSEERGLVISFAGDAFFGPASARINIDQTRDILLRLASLLNSDELRGRKFRIEGHTDSEVVDPNGPWTDNWDLSTARAIAVLRYLTDIGVDQNRFQVAGFADTMPISTNNTPEGRAYNRRVDVVILDEGHL